MYSIPSGGQPIFWIRHAQTYYNEEGIIQGILNDAKASITPQGIQQAKAFYEAYRRIPFCAVITSTLNRTYETVRYFLEANQEIKWYRLPELNELHWGNWEGKPVEQYQVELKECYREWDSGNYTYAPYSGEAPIEGAKRSTPILKKLLQDLPFNCPVLVCLHSRISRILFCELFGYPLRYMRHFPHKNVGLHLLSRQKNNEFILHRYNDITHLLLCESPW